MPIHNAHFACPRLCCRVRGAKAASLPTLSIPPSARNPTLRDGYRSLKTAERHVAPPCSCRCLVSTTGPSGRHTWVGPSCPRYPLLLSSPFTVWAASPGPLLLVYIKRRAPYSLSPSHLGVPLETTDPALLSFTVILPWFSFIKLPVARLTKNPPNCWIRPLIEEGIEPHPGPRYISKNLNGVQTKGRFETCIYDMAQEHKRSPVAAFMVQEHNLPASRAAWARAYARARHRILWLSRHRPDADTSGKGHGTAIAIPYDQIELKPDESLHQAVERLLKSLTGTKDGSQSISRPSRTTAPSLI